MEMLLVAALTLGAVAAIWFLSQLGFVWVVVGLSICLLSLIVTFLKKRMANKDEHLYDAPPIISSIRQPLSPMDYSYRSNLDVPFFSFESKNYGKKTPRRRVRGIPIDRFLEFEVKTETLLNQMQELSDQISTVVSQVSSARATVAEITSKPEARTVTKLNEAVTHQASPTPKHDTTLPSAPSNLVIAAVQSVQKVKKSIQAPFIRVAPTTSSPVNKPPVTSIYDEIGNLCGSCGGKLKNFQCVDRCDPLNQ